MATNPGEPYPDTVTEALDLLTAEGYDGSFSVDPAAVHCGTCRVHHTGDVALVDRVFRFEGMSNPDDEEIVFALRCPDCGAKGSMVSAFGPGADPEVLDLLVMLHGRTT